MAESVPPWGSLPGPPRNSNQRSLPIWMDPQRIHGDVQFLLMKPANANTKLPSNPFIIAKSIDAAAGRIDGANAIDAGKNYLLRVRNPKQSEKLQQLNKLIDGTPVTVQIHPTLNTCQCVVTCREVSDLSDDDLAKALEDEGVIKAYRFVKKFQGKSFPSDSIVLTIRGTAPPTHIRFGYLRIATRPYYSRPMLCQNCGNFGHTKAKCTNETICQVCGESPSHTDCTNQPHCNNCGGPHPTTNRSCPINKQEQEIIRIRTDLGISHSEATRQFKSRMEAAKNSTLQLRLNKAQSIPDDKDRKIQQLERQIAELGKINSQETIFKLEKQVTELIEQNSKLVARIMAMKKEQNPVVDEEDDDDTLTETCSNPLMDTSFEINNPHTTPKRGRTNTPPDDNPDLDDNCPTMKKMNMNRNTPSPPIETNDQTRYPQQPIPSTTQNPAPSYHPSSRR
ncbi:uncharacterized protein LOC129753256 [Uranotaenia lowii]|uniref:uncharacterized protein LOC129753256 n=1 Tax=Uranotaenia lowii TaxID=190385 RepID=UPI00247A2D15|nr:uncharacterized protein LOC129753256 [Uranotaenia lowii]